MEGRYFACFLSHSVSNRVGPRRCVGDSVCVPRGVFLSLGYLSPLVDGSISGFAPDSLGFFFQSSYFDPDIRLFVKWVASVGFYFD